VQNLSRQVQIPKDGTSSRTIHHDERVKVLVLGFAGGPELPAHSISEPVILQVLQGNARVTLDGEEKEMSGGSLIFIEANLPHALYARNDLIMRLTSLTGPQVKKIALSFADEVPVVSSALTRDSAFLPSLRTGGQVDYTKAKNALEFG
jgi:quercetin dioxygenase-like cupin family protein